MDCTASSSPPPSELAYDADSESEVAHIGVPPNFGVRPCYDHGSRANVENVEGGG